MEKTTLVIVFALLLSVCSIHLPWIHSKRIGLTYYGRIEYWVWPFMQRVFFYRGELTPPLIEYELFDQLWDHDFGSPIDYTMRMIVTRTVPELAGGYYVIFLLQLLTILFQSICIATDRIPLLREPSLLLLILFYIGTFVISFGAVIVGVNQYVETWVDLPQTVLVEFSTGFYLAVLSSISTLIYALRFIIKIYREPL